MEKTIALIPGDGIGPDVVKEAVNVQMELHKCSCRRLCNR